MPELPEVETIVRGLHPKMRGETIQGLKIRDPQLLRNTDSDELRKYAIGSTISTVRRVGKYILVKLSNQLNIAIHLRMTGKLLLKSLKKTTKYERCRFQLEENQVVFEDMRRLATLDLLTDTDKGPLSNLGIDPLGSKYRWKKFAKLLESRQEIKRLLLDQHKIVGLGNIYANEVLHSASISPWKQAEKLSVTKGRRLFRTIPHLLREAIQAEGTTIDTYRDSTGSPGNFQHLLHVYGQQGQPCPRCQSPIDREKQGGRSTFYCPQCQQK